MFCCTLLCVRSSIAIILVGKRELVALLNLSSSCPVMVERLFLAVPQGCLQYVIVVFPDHTHLLFFSTRDIIRSQVVTIISSLGMNRSSQESRLSRFFHLFLPHSIRVRMSGFKK